MQLSQANNPTKMNRRIAITALILAFTLSAAISSLAQQPSPTPLTSTPTDAKPAAKPNGEDQQEPVKVTIEEVQIPVTAFDVYGHLDPTLGLNDLLILENGVRVRVGNLDLTFYTAQGFRSLIQQRAVG